MKGRENIKFQSRMWGLELRDGNRGKVTNKWQANPGYEGASYCKALGVCLHSFNYMHWMVSMSQTLHQVQRIWHFMDKLNNIPHGADSLRLNGSVSGKQHPCLYKWQYIFYPRDKMVVYFYASRIFSSYNPLVEQYIRNMDAVLNYS